MANVRRRKVEVEPASSTSSTSAILKKAFRSRSEWPDKDEFLDVVYWMKQILSILVGAVWGIVPLQGIIGIGLFGAINAGVTYVYTMAFQKVDEDEYGGLWEIIKEGFMSSFAMFMVTWIIMYSALHYE